MGVEVHKVCSERSDCAHSLLLKSHYGHVMIGHGLVDWLLLLFFIQF
jgi:hypothetical protein